MMDDPEQPVFSVIITCFNKELCIERAVQSAKCLSPRTEVIVVDDCSSDTSRAVISAMDIEGKIFHETNKGALQAYLSGMRAAKGKYIVMLDGDDYLVPDLFPALFSHLDSETSARLGMGSGTIDAIGGAELKRQFTFRPGRWLAVTQNTGGTAYVFPTAVFQKCDHIFGQKWPDISVQDHILPGIMALNSKRFLKFSTVCYLVDDDNPTTRLSARTARCNHDRVISDHAIYTAACSTMPQPYLARILLKIALVKRLRKYAKIYGVKIPTGFGLFISAKVCDSALRLLTRTILDISKQDNTP